MEFFEETMKEWDERKKNRFFLLNWIDDDLFKGESLFSYRPSYVIFRPHIIIREMWQETRFAYQRVVRGWDDRVVWSVDVWLTDIMPDILSKLKDDKVGVPGQFFKNMEHDEHYGYTDEQHRLAKEKWNLELDKMIDGFRAAKKLNDLEYSWKDGKREESEKYLMNVFENGMNSFRDNFFSLWD